MEHTKVRQWEAEPVTILGNWVAESGALVEKFLVSHGPSKTARRSLGGSGDSLSFSSLSLCPLFYKKIHTVPLPLLERLSTETFPDSGSKKGVRNSDPLNGPAPFVNELLLTFPFFKYIKIKFWSAYVPCGAQYLDAVKQTLEQIDLIKRMVDRYPHYLRLALDAQGENDTHPTLRARIVQPALCPIYYDPCLINQLLFWFVCVGD